MQGILARCGHTVKATDNGSEALRWLGEQPDLLICALRMPTLDGPLLHSEVLSRWRTAAPKTFFVLAVGETAAYSQELKALDVPVLLKPFALPDLMQMVERVLQTV